MTKKGNLLYKVVTIITLCVPLPIYLFLSATLFNINADYQFTTKIENIEFVGDFIYTTDLNSSIIGNVVYDSELAYWGVRVTQDDIVKTKDGYYSLIDNELKDIKTLTIQKEQSYKIPLAFFISAFGVGIVAMVVMGKMGVAKKRPRLATFVSLLTLTLVFYIINLIISNLLGVFLVATISWAIYCLEYLVVQGKLQEKESQKAQSDLTRMLSEALK